MNMDEQQLPPGWVEAKIDELLPPLADGKTMHQGWSPRCDGGPATANDEWAVLKTTSIQDGEFQPQHNKKIPSHLPPRPRLEVKTGDLLITSAGPRIRCGVPCLVRQTRPRLMISGKMYRFRAPQELDSVYFESVLRSPLLQKAIDEIKTGIDESGLNLTHERFRDLTIPIPPIPEQRRIIAKIEALQERSGRAAKALEEVGPLLEHFRQSILAAAFSGRLTADWREKNPNVEPAEEMVNRLPVPSKPPRASKASIAKIKGDCGLSVGLTDVPIPATWCWTPLIRLGQLVTGHTPSRQHPEYWDGDIPWIGIKDAANNNGHVILETLQHVTELGIQNSASRLLPKDTVLMTRTANSIGYSVVLGTDMATSQDLVGWILPEEVNPKYIMYLMLAEHDALYRFAKGSAHPTIYFPEILSFHIALPPTAEQDEIVGRVERILRTLDAQRASVAASRLELQQLNQSILAKAFRGELEPQDPNDEPASELLARIRMEREVSGDRVQGSGRKKRAGGKGNASESARTAKRSKRTSKAASSTTPDTSADTSPEPARPQRRSRRSSSNNEDPSLVIRVLAEGGAVNIHADTSGPQVLFYTKSSGGGLMAEIEDIPEADLKPNESARAANLADLMESEMALLYPENIHPTYLPQLRAWYTSAVRQLPSHFDEDFLQDAKTRWSEALQIEESSTPSGSSRRRNSGRLFDA